MLHKLVQNSSKGQPAASWAADQVDLAKRKTLGEIVNHPTSFLRDQRSKAKCQRQELAAARAAAKEKKAKEKKAKEKKQHEKTKLRKAPFGSSQLQRS
jgi:hypothetical protein